MLLNWNSNILNYSGYHFLQTEEWGKFKSHYGWKSQYLNLNTDNQSGATLILSRKISILSSKTLAEIKYCPRGPLLNWSESSIASYALDQLEKQTKTNNTIFIKIDPELRISDNNLSDLKSGNLQEHNPVAQLKKRGWIFSKDQIQYRNSVILSLEPSLDTLLKNMKQKTRYNIHLADKKGIKIFAGESEDLSILFKMYAETSIRDGFVIREENYYIQMWKQFMDSGMAVPLIAYFDNIPIAGLILFIFGKKAWYFFGMSRNMHREKMPTYLLQWEAIKIAKERGCGLYDLWGAPDSIDEDSPMWGVYRFKEGLGGQLVQWIGAWDFTSRPALYKLYASILPTVLSLMRKRGKQITEHSIQ